LGIDIDEVKAVALLDAERTRRITVDMNPDRRTDGTVVRP
jgi:hypothetical protein